MGAWGGRHPRRSYYATDRQVAYLRALLIQCFARRVAHGLSLDYNHLDNVTFERASYAIERCKTVLAQASR